LAGRGARDALSAIASPGDAPSEHQPVDAGREGDCGRARGHGRRTRVLGIRDQRSADTVLTRAGGYPCLTSIRHLYREPSNQCRLLLEMAEDAGIPVTSR